MNLGESGATQWRSANIQAFWGEIAPCDHLVQFYENDAHFLNTLEGFAGSGILSGDSVIIIATQKHLQQLNKRLEKQGFNIDSLVIDNRYFPLEASETLAAFTLNNWPDEALFNSYITKLLKKAKTNGTKVRAFGEMVAVLWEQGHTDATVQLENLWHNLHHQDNFSLFCAYPKSAFAQQATESLNQICKAHSKIIDGDNRPSTEIYYVSA
ncbi:MAG TPA: MEDS domain-containing protein [Flavobacterium sp.]|jgi:hypothetical protein